MATTRKKRRSAKRSLSRPKPDGKVMGFRARELKWRETHGKELRQYAGEWVALEDEQIIAHGRDAGAVVTEARERGVPSPYVFFVHPRLPHGTVLLGGV